MRLHRLSITAFGPFVETAEVDFDALSDAGLFLLSGATGSGKSSVLDAVCFALYGAIPGDRNHAGRLRSDQAPARTRPVGDARGDAGGPTVPAGAVARVGPAQEARHRHDPRAREGDPQRVGRRPVARAEQSPRRDRRPGVRPARDEPRPVLPGGAAPAGSVPGVPAGRLRSAAPAARAAVPHRQVRARRGVAARSPTVPAPRLRGPSRSDLRSREPHLRGRRGRRTRRVRPRSRRRRPTAPSGPGPSRCATRRERWWRRRVRRSSS